MQELLLEGVKYIFFEALNGEAAREIDGWG